MFLVRLGHILKELSHPAHELVTFQHEFVLIQNQHQLMPHLSPLLIDTHIQSHVLQAFVVLNVQQSQAYADQCPLIQSPLMVMSLFV